MRRVRIEEMVFDWIPPMLAGGRDSRCAARPSGATPLGQWPRRDVTPVAEP